MKLEIGYLFFPILFVNCFVRMNTKLAFFFLFVESCLFFYIYCIFDIRVMNLYGCD